MTAFSPSDSSHQERPTALFAKAVDLDGFGFAEERGFPLVVKHRCKDGRLHRPVLH